MWIKSSWKFKHKSSWETQEHKKLDSNHFESFKYILMNVCLIQNIKYISCEFSKMCWCKFALKEKKVNF